MIRSCAARGVKKVGQHCTKGKKCAHGTGSLITLPISQFDISASGIGFDLNTRLLPSVLVESTCCAACAHAQ